jgi:hypothetical protein
MKPAAAIIVIFVIILTFAMGAFAMNAMMNSGNHANCLAAIPGSPECVGGMTPLQFAMTHINALGSASLGIVGTFAALLLAALALLAWLVVADESDVLAVTSSCGARVFSGMRFRGARKQYHWISILEKRDPSLAYAMN